MIYVLAIFLPLIAAAIAGIFGRWIKGRGAQVLTCGAMSASALLSLVILNEVGLNHEPKTLVLFSWIVSGEFAVDWALRFDTLTAVMLVVVTVVSCAVHFYSIGYMHNDPSVPRFFSYLSLFTFFMLILVTSNNFLQLFFGWEGVGLASYLLIGFCMRSRQPMRLLLKHFSLTA